MSETLFMAERRSSILDMLREQGRVSVNELSKRLLVSAVTIRQDLRALEADKLLERTHGGAVLPRRQSVAPELTFDVRLRERRAIKDLLAQAAASRVQSGATIALDSSTTVFSMLPILKRLNRLIVVTHSVMITSALLDSPQIQVIMPGGVLRRDSIALVGSANNLPDIHIQIGFFSAHGITSETGATESSQEEATMKRALMSRCITTCYLIDDSKWGKVAPFTLASAKEIDMLIAPQSSPRNELQYFQKHGAEIVTVEAS
jgi:DeoR/GlpR family transcriptional regulator of sugar metabolism